MSYFSAVQAYLRVKFVEITVDVLDGTWRELIRIVQVLIVEHLRSFRHEELIVCRTRVAVSVDVGTKTVHRTVSHNIARSSRSDAVVPWKSKSILKNFKTFQCFILTLTDRQTDRQKDNGPIANRFTKRRPKNDILSLYCATLRYRCIRCVPVRICLSVRPSVRHELVFHQNC